MEVKTLDVLGDEPNAGPVQSKSKPPDDVMDHTPICSCDCCHTAIRRPDEQRKGKTDLKCIVDTNSTDPNHMEECPAQCQLSLLDKDVVSNGVTDLQFYEYYCFVQCKPVGTDVGGKCMNLKDGELSKAQTDDGTGEDIFATPESLLPPTVPPTAAPMPDIPLVTDAPLKILEPEVDKTKAAEAPEEKKDGSAAAAKADALKENAKVQAKIAQAEGAAKGAASEAEKNALEVRKVMEAPLSPNGFLLQLGVETVPISVH